MNNQQRMFLGIAGCVCAQISGLFWHPFPNEEPWFGIVRILGAAVWAVIAGLAIGKATRVKH